jgi:hypothetical protein
MIIIANGRSGGGVAHAASTVEVHVKQASTTDQSCEESISGGHFVINQISSPPASITVMLSDGTSSTVPLSQQTSKVAHYALSFADGLTIVDATASVPVDWTGQFVLSNYVCSATPTTTPPPSPTSSPNE